MAASSKSRAWLCASLVLAACTDEEGWFEPWEIPNVGAKLDGGLDASRTRRDARVADAGDARVPVACTRDSGSDLFDPERVYLFGALSEGGSCGRDVVTPADMRDVASGRFDCSVNKHSAFVRPTDGRLLYTVSGEKAIYGFYNDGCLSDGTFREPKATLNDERIAEASCPEGYRSFTNYLVAPDGGVLFRCNTTWVDANSRVVLPSSPALHSLGMENTALRGTTIYSFSTETSTPVVGLPGTEPDAGLHREPVYRAVRARADGYWVAISPQQPFNQEPVELWHIAFDGTATRVGVYPAPPETQATQFSGGTAKLDGEGRLYQFARYEDDALWTFDTIIRRSVQGESEIVYDEVQLPLVKIFSATLFTGP